MKTSSKLDSITNWGGLLIQGNWSGGNTSQCTSNPYIARFTTVLEPKGAVLESKGGLLEPTGAVLEPTGAALEPTGAVVEPKGVVLEPKGVLPNSAFWNPS